MLIGELEDSCAFDVHNTQWNTGGVFSKYYPKLRSGGRSTCPVQKQKYCWLLMQIHHFCLSDFSRNLSQNNLFFFPLCDMGLGSTKSNRKQKALVWFLLIARETSYRNYLFFFLKEKIIWHQVEKNIMFSCNWSQFLMTLSIQAVPNWLSQ